MIRAAGSVETRRTRSNALRTKALAPFASSAIRIVKASARRLTRPILSGLLYVANPRAQARDGTSLPAAGPR